MLTTSHSQTKRTNRKIGSGLPKQDINNQCANYQRKDPPKKAKITQQQHPGDQRAKRQEINPGHTTRNTPNPFPYSFRCLRNNHGRTGNQPMPRNAGRSASIFLYFSTLMQQPLGPPGPKIKKTGRRKRSRIMEKRQENRSGIK